MSAGHATPRPHKKAEFVIEFATHSAQKGWRDCLAVARNATVDAWDRLTTAPMLRLDFRLIFGFAKQVDGLTPAIEGPPSGTGTLTSNGSRAAYKVPTR